MTNNAYKEAGVDIDAGAELVERIKPAVKKTSRSGVMSGIGGFGALFDLKETGYKDPVLVSSTDGVGTKIKVAIESGIHATIGQDLVAMCVNDIVVQGAEPLFFLDYFATGKLDLDTAETIVNSIAKGCEIAGCALIGGETAEMPGLYSGEDYDLAGFAVGAVDRAHIITGERIKEGDIILGLASNGLHSNGFSLVRKIVGGTQGYGYDSKAPFAPDQKMGEALLAPTRIYIKPILEALKDRDSSGYGLIKGMAHITGGGLTENIPRVIPENLKAVIDTSNWDIPPVFGWLAEAGQLSYEDMYRTFNCGIGMAVIISGEHADKIKESLENSGEQVFRIGEIHRTETGPAIDFKG